MKLKLRELLTKILTAFTSSTETLTGSYNLLAVAYKRCGAVMLRVEQTGGATLPKGQWVTVGTLSEKYRPSYQVDAIISDNAATTAAQNSLLLRVTTAGSVRVWAFTDSRSTNQVYAAVTYLANIL